MSCKHAKISIAFFSKTAFLEIDHYNLNGSTDNSTVINSDTHSELCCIKLYFVDFCSFQYVCTF